jgi:hypothetical protein
LAYEGSPPSAVADTILIPKSGTEFENSKKVIEHISSYKHPKVTQRVHPTSFRRSFTGYVLKAVQSSFKDLLRSSEGSEQRRVLTRRDAAFAGVHWIVAATSGGLW